MRRDKPQQASSRAQDALTEEQLDALLDAVNARYPSGKRNLALLLIMADAGLRVSEAVSLRTTDLVVEGGQYTHVNIRRGKGGKPGRVALTVRAAAKLGAWLDARTKMGFGKGHVFCTISRGMAGGQETTTRLSHSQPSHPPARLPEVAGWHQVLRHTHANRCADAQRTGCVCSRYRPPTSTRARR
ncbi:MAG: phage integrase family protein, partial [Armatimonadetes bacterium]|nr:phage integrase family protein [Armatimonadota bacterium]